MRSIYVSLLLLPTLALATAAHAAVFSVGNDILGCTHRRISDAIAAAEANGRGTDVIRVNANYSGAASTLNIIDHSLQLIGGFANCGATTPIAITRLLAPANTRVITVVGYPERATYVELRNVLISNGSPADAGGGLAVFGRATVLLKSSRIQSNRADRGGGVYVDGMNLATAAELIVDASRIDYNQARVEGAGIYCRGAGRVVLRNTSFVTDNGRDGTAAWVGYGGGAFLDGCSWDQDGGALYYNRARFGGGGIHAQAGAKVMVRSGANGAPSSVSNNRAGSESLGGYGGAIAAIGIGTDISLSGTLVTYNQGAAGSAFSVRGGARLHMQRDARCESLPNGCSDIFRNTAIGGFPSVIEVAQDSLVSIAQTRIVGNTARTASGAKGTIIDLFNPDAAAPAQLALHSTSFTDNDGSSLIRLYASQIGDAREEFYGQFITSKGNRIDQVLIGSARPGTRVELRASIIDEAAPFYAGATLPSGIYDCLLSSSPLNVATTRSVVADPMLDFQLIPVSTSPVIDFCSGDGLALYPDLRGIARPINDNVLDRYGTIDLGAIEYKRPSPF